MEKVRIQKVMADNGVCSRRKAESLIEEGRVKVNGHPALIGQKIDPMKDLITVDGERVFVARKKTHLYLMMHKPRLSDIDVGRSRPPLCDRAFAKRFAGARVPGRTARPKL